MTRRLDVLQGDPRSLQSQVLRDVVKEQQTICLQPRKVKKKTYYANILPSFMRLMFLLQRHNEQVLKGANVW